MANAMLDARQEGDSYRRVEVITGERRRRRWTGEEKARIVAENFEEGANISEVARRNGVARGLLTVWRRQIATAVTGKGRADPNWSRERWRDIWRVRAYFRRHRRGLWRLPRRRPGQQFPSSDGDCHTPLPREVRRGKDTTPRACCPNSAAPGAGEAA